MDIQGKKLLILAGAGVHCKVVRAAKEMGVYTIVTDYLDVEHSPAKLLADEYWDLNITDVDAIVEKCKTKQVDGVLNFCIDPAQIPYQRICEKLHFPCYGTREQFDVLTDKIQFKRFCRAHDVDVIPDYTEEDILKDCVDYPIFVKPTNSRGSRGQTVCHTKAEALDAVAFAKKESKDGGFLCEKYLGGHRDIGSALFVIDGEPHLVKFADRHLGQKADNLDKQVMCTFLPSTFSAKFDKEILPRVKNMIRSLGIKYGPVFMQGLIDGDTIRYYDPAQRMPGGDYDVVLDHATGFSTVKSLVHFALTGDVKYVWGNPKDAYKLEGGVALLLTYSVRPGVIARIDGMEEIRQMDNVVYARQILPVGTNVPPTGDISQRAVAVGTYLPRPTAHDIDQLVEEVASKLRILDENGEDMIVSRYRFSEGDYGIE